MNDREIVSQAGKRLPALTHRSNARPFRWNPLAGDDPLRIYLLTSGSYYVAKSEDPEVIAELKTRRSYSLTRVFGSIWMLMLCFVVAWIANEMRSPEIAWAMLGVGGLGAVSFGGVMVLDYLQILRLPRTILSVRNDGRIVFYDGALEVSNYQSLGLHTRWTRPGKFSPTGSRTCVFDLQVVQHGRKHIYQLAATLGSELSPLARRLSSATGIPLGADEANVEG
ncbi:MAG: hypothetical protein AAFN77_06175 [Planctomycetota bacterium]